MDSYAIYIWAGYIMTFLLLAVNVIFVWLEKDKVLKNIQLAITRSLGLL